MNSCITFPPFAKLRRSFLFSSFHLKEHFVSALFIDKKLLFSYERQFADSHGKFSAKIVKESLLSLHNSYPEMKFCCNFCIFCICRVFWIFIHFSSLFFLSYCQFFRFENEWFIIFERKKGKMMVFVRFLGISWQFCEKDYEMV